MSYQKSKQFLQIISGNEEIRIAENETINKRFATTEKSPIYQMYKSNKNPCILIKTYE